MQVLAGFLEVLVDVGAETHQAWPACQGVVTFGHGGQVLE